MTKDQIEKYEVCKKDLQQLESWKTKLPFGAQNHGCGSSSPAIYFELEKIHYEMHNKVLSAINEAIKVIEGKIASL